MISRITSSLLVPALKRVSASTSSCLTRRLLHQTALTSSAAATSTTTTQQPYVSANSATAEGEWSQQLSFAAPESDFGASNSNSDTDNNDHITSHINMDYLHLRVSASGATSEAEWSQELSFVSPEADFTAANKNSARQKATDRDAQTLQQMVRQWQLSSPESAIGYTSVAETMNAATKEAFTSVLRQEGLPTTSASVTEATEVQLNPAEVDRMMQQLQMSSPESALGFTHAGESLSETNQQELKSLFAKTGVPSALPEESEIQLNLAEVDRMMQYLQIASPESALGFTHVGETLAEANQQELKSWFAYTGLPSALPQDSTEELDQTATDLMMQQLLRASPESSTGYVHVAEGMASHDRHDLTTALAMAAAQQQQQAPPLPTSYEQAVTDHHQRAIVITTATAPFKVVHVNEVWEGLCGFTHSEALNQPIGDLLRGPETQRINAMVSSLENKPEQPQDVNLVNYTKTGRRFRNHLQVGPLFASTADSTKKVEYLVGILEEIHDDNEKACTWRRKGRGQ